MSNLPYATERQPSYENFAAACPHCRFQNVFNRASDLNDVEPIDLMAVACFKCGNEFNITGDSAQAGYEMLIADIGELKAAKRYMYCILNLAQACEVFFATYLNVSLLYQPFKHDPSDDLEKLNENSESLYKRIGRFSFGEMRNLFLIRVIAANSPKSLADAEMVISNLPEKPNEPSDNALKLVIPTSLSALLLRLKQSDIVCTRNKVVHKYAHRPTLDDVEKAHKETTEILYGLAHLLKIEGNDINDYNQPF